MAQNSRSMHGLTIGTTAPTASLTFHDLGATTARAGLPRLQLRLGSPFLASIVASPLVLLLERTRLEARVAPPTALGSDDVRLIVGRGGCDDCHLHARRSHCGFGRHRLSLNATTAHEDQGEDKSNDDADDGADDGADDDSD